MSRSRDGRIYSLLAVVVLSMSIVGSAVVGEERRATVALDAQREPLVVIARESRALACGDLLGGPADEWVAALETGGLLVHSDDEEIAGNLMIPGVAAEALTVAGKRLIVALTGGGIVSLDLVAEEASPLSFLEAVSLAADDFDGDGADEVVAVLADGTVYLFDVADGSAVVSSLSVGAAVAVTSGRLLPDRDGQQLAVLHRGGSVQIVDFLRSESQSCYFASALSSPGGGGDDVSVCSLTALPSGILLALSPSGSFAAIDPASCESLEFDPSSLELVHQGAIFSVLQVTREEPPPPCSIGAVSCRPLPDGSGVEVSWDVAGSPGCACQQFAIRGPNREILAVVSGDDRGTTIPCEDLGDITSLTVSCVGANGEELAASCDFEACGIVEEGLRLPGDCNQDSVVDISDSLCLLLHLFAGRPAELPCGDGTAAHPANRALLDSNGDSVADIGDAVYVLVHLFTGGPSPARGRECVVIPGCSDRCER